MRRLGATLGWLGLGRDVDGNLTLGVHSGIPAIDRFREAQVEGYSHNGIAACFLGNKAENERLLTGEVLEAIAGICAGRRMFHPEDPVPMNKQVMESEHYQVMVARIKETARTLREFLSRHYLPFYSMRYQGHMNWDVTLPAIIGYFTTMLLNPNNVASQVSPATTMLEYIVGRDLCYMIGFSRDPEPWSHLTCDGTVANMESVWSTRELKFFAVAVRDAIADADSLERKPFPYADAEVQDALRAAADIRFTAPDGSAFCMLDERVDAWFLLNLDCDSILSFPRRIAEHRKRNTAGDKDVPSLERRVWTCLLENYALSVRGFYPLCIRLAADSVQMPAVIVPSSKHYSWPKSTAILGLGCQSGPDRQGMLNVFVDANGRMDMAQLRQTLEACRRNRMPVLQVVAVIGSTMEGAVDPLREIIALREELRHGGDGPFMDFNIHADAAWGGYLLSAIRRPYGLTDEPSAELFDTDGVLLSDHTIGQLQAVRHCDSVTIDPHKWGYAPYPAGSLNYRNGLVTNLVTFGAPYNGNDRGGSGPAFSIGESGIEGSKPGAAAAGVYLSHSILRPDRTGYGQLMQGALFNAKVFFLHLLRIAHEFDVKGTGQFRPYVLGAGKQFHAPEFWADFWRSPLIGQFMARSISDAAFVAEIAKPEQYPLIRALGPDQSTLAYAFNLRGNRDPGVANHLNARIFEYLYPSKWTEPISIESFEMFVTMTTFRLGDYGEDYMRDFARELDVDFEPRRDTEINCLRSVVMDPWMINTLDGAEDFIGSTLIPALLKAAEKAAICELHS